MEYPPWSNEDYQRQLELAFFLKYMMENHPKIIVEFVRWSNS